MKLRFYLRNNKVSAYVTINGTKERFTTGIECIKENWKNGYPNRNQTLIIQKLQAIEKPVNDYIDTNVILNKDAIKNIIDEVLHGKREDRQSLSLLIDKYLDYKKHTVRNVTITKINRHLKHLKDYCSNAKLIDVNKRFINEYIQTLTTTDLLNSSINVYIKDVQAFLTYLYNNDYIDNYIKINKLKENEKNIIALTIDELATLITTNDLTPKHERINDLFIFSCLTGLRFADCLRVNKDMIKYNEQKDTYILNIKQQKTSNIIDIILIKEAINILIKYDFQFRKISNQKVNDYLKEIFKILEINRLIYDNKTDTYKQLSELITFHIARKTYVTNSLSAGISTKIVQSQSGHRKDDIFNQYIDISNDTMIDESVKYQKYIDNSIDKINKNKNKK